MFSIMRGDKEIQSVKINIDNLEKKFAGQKNSCWQYQLTQSSETLFGVRMDLKNKEQHYFYQNYQACIFYHTQHRFQIFEF